MELERSRGEFEPIHDPRPRMDEPPPVRLIAIADVRLPAVAGLERQLDDFYLGLLSFWRDEQEPLVYRAENFRVRFDIYESADQIPRDDLRALAVEIKSLAEMEKQLLDRKIEYLRENGLLPGQDRLRLRDPAGNWVELSEQILVF